MENKGLMESKFIHELSRVAPEIEKTPINDAKRI